MQQTYKKKNSDKKTSRHNSKIKESDNSYSYEKKESQIQLMEKESLLTLNALVKDIISTKQDKNIPPSYNEIIKTNYRRTREDTWRPVRGIAMQLSGHTINRKKHICSTSSCYQMKTTWINPVRKLVDNCSGITCNCDRTICNCTTNVLYCKYRRKAYNLNLNINNNNNISNNDSLKSNDQDSIKTVNVVFDITDNKTNNNNNKISHENNTNSPICYPKISDSNNDYQSSDWQEIDLPAFQIDDDETIPSESPKPLLNPFLSIENIRKAKKLRRLKKGNDKNVNQTSNCSLSLIISNAAKFTMTEGKNIIENDSTKEKKLLGEHSKSDNILNCINMSREKLNNTKNDSSINFDKKKNSKNQSRKYKMFRKDKIIHSLDNTDIENNISKNVTNVKFNQKQKLIQDNIKFNEIYKPIDVKNESKVKQSNDGQRNIVNKNESLQMLLEYNSSDSNDDITDTVTIYESKLYSDKQNNIIKTSRNKNDINNNNTNDESKMKEIKIDKIKQNDDNKIKIDYHNQNNHVNIANMSSEKEINLNQMPHDNNIKKNEINNSNKNKEIILSSNLVNTSQLNNLNNIINCNFKRPIDNNHINEKSNKDHKHTDVLNRQAKNNKDIKYKNDDNYNADDEGVETIIKYHTIKGENQKLFKNNNLSIKNNITKNKVQNKRIIKHIKHPTPNSSNNSDSQNTETEPFDTPKHTPRKITYKKQKEVKKQISGRNKFEEIDSCNPKENRAPEKQVIHNKDTLRDYLVPNKEITDCDATQGNNCCCNSKTKHEYKECCDKKKNKAILYSGIPELINGSAQITASHIQITNSHIFENKEDLEDNNIGCLNMLYSPTTTKSKQQLLRNKVHTENIYEYEIVNKNDHKSNKIKNNLTTNDNDNLKNYRFINSDKLPQPRQVNSSHNSEMVIKTINQELQGAYQAKADANTENKIAKSTEFSNETGKKIPNNHLEIFDKESKEKKTSNEIKKILINGKYDSFLHKEDNMLLENSDMDSRKESTTNNEKNKENIGRSIRLQPNESDKSKSIFVSDEQLENKFEEFLLKRLQKNNFSSLETSDKTSDDIRNYLINCFGLKNKQNHKQNNIRDYDNENGLYTKNPKNSIDCKLVEKNKENNNNDLRNEHLIKNKASLENFLSNKICQEENVLNTKKPLVNFHKFFDENANSRITNEPAPTASVFDNTGSDSSRDSNEFRKWTNRKPQFSKNFTKFVDYVPRWRLQSVNRKQAWTNGASLDRGDDNTLNKDRMFNYDDDETEEEFDDDDDDDDDTNIAKQVKQYYDCCSQHIDYD